MKRLLTCLLALLLSVTLFLSGPGSAAASVTEIETVDHVLEGELGCYVEPVTGRPLVYFFLQEAPPDLPYPLELQDATLAPSKLVEFIRARLSLNQFGAERLDYTLFVLYKPGIEQGKNLGDDPQYRIISGESNINGALLYSTFDVVIPYRKGFYGLGAVFLGSKPIPRTLVYAQLTGNAAHRDLYSLDPAPPSQIKAKANDLSPTAACTNLSWDETTLFRNSPWIRRKILQRLQLPLSVKIRLGNTPFKDVPVLPRQAMPNVPQLAPIRVPTLVK